ncbi:MAG: hypothetical protein JNM83_02790 [Myxococcales bacterium]|nr:hypothetical protein [Myxococcales bacterium]
MKEFLSISLLLVFVGAIAFLALRSLWLWYWKIDEIVRLLGEQNKLLAKIAATSAVTMLQGASAHQLMEQPQSDES